MAGFAAMTMALALARSPGCCGRRDVMYMCPAMWAMPPAWAGGVDWSWARVAESPIRMHWIARFRDLKLEDMMGLLIEATGRGWAVNLYVWRACLVPRNISREPTPSSLLARYFKS